MTGFNVDRLWPPRPAIAEAISKFLRRGAEHGRAFQGDEDLTGEENADLTRRRRNRKMNPRELERMAEEAPIIKLVNLILTDAVKRGGQRYYNRTLRKESSVRFRIDGILQRSCAAVETSRCDSAASKSWPSSTSAKSGCRKTAAS